MKLKSLINKVKKLGAEYIAEENKIVKGHAIINLSYNVSGDEVYLSYINKVGRIESIATLKELTFLLTEEVGMCQFAKEEKRTEFSMWN